MHGTRGLKPVRIVVNDVVGIGDAEEIFSQLQNAATRFLKHSLDHLGTIPRDEQLIEAVRHQIPVVDYAPETRSSRSFRLIAKHLDQTHRQSNEVMAAPCFWQSLGQISN